MSFWNFATKWVGRSGRLFGVDLDAPFDPATGHTHNGVDSKTLAAVPADEASLTAAGGHLAIKAAGVNLAALNSAVTAKLVTPAAHIAHCAGSAPTAAEYDALLDALSAAGLMAAS